MLWTKSGSLLDKADDTCFLECSRNNLRMIPDNHSCLPLRHSSDFWRDWSIDPSLIVSIIFWQIFFFILPSQSLDNNRSPSSAEEHLPAKGLELLQIQSFIFMCTAMVDTHSVSHLNDISSIGANKALHLHESLLLLVGTYLFGYISKAFGSLYVLDKRHSPVFPPSIVSSILIKVPFKWSFLTQILIIIVSIESWAIQRKIEDRSCGKSNLSSSYRWF